MIVLQSLRVLRSKTHLPLHKGGLSKVEDTVSLIPPYGAKWILTREAYEICASSASPYGAAKQVLTWEPDEVCTSLYYSLAKLAQA